MPNSSGRVKNNSDQQPNHFDEACSVEAFKSYIDAQISSLLQSLVGLPSASSPTISSNFDNSHYEFFTPDGPTNPYQSPLGSAIQSCSHQPRECLLCSISHMTREGHNFRVSPQIGFTNGLLFGEPFQSGLSELNKTAFPFDYLLFSPYSPLQLENLQGFQNDGKRWRNAFEDLLEAAEGRDMTSNNSSTLKMEETGSQAWILSLLRRSNIGQTFDSYGQTSTFKDTFGKPAQEAKKDIDVEHEVYSQFLNSPERFSSAAKKSGSFGSATNASLSPKDSISAPGSQNNGSKTGINNANRIISILTKTERTVSSDGEVHTKVVLKKRFADGREESSETAETTQDLPINTNPQSKNFKSRAKYPTSIDNEKEDKKSKGWFGSN
ncbi:MAG: hypothetical protein M1829_003279 [Trizodia sp. TS-e1964]|nr:MAG: hypothetical protein M1829_003279 [Trizodia sp. TS-e1964]